MALATPEIGLKAIYKNQYVTAMLNSGVVASGKDVRNIKFYNASFPVGANNFYINGPGIEYNDKVYYFSQSKIMILSFSPNITKKTGSTGNQINHSHASTNNFSSFSSVNGLGTSSIGILDHTHGGTNNTDAKTVYHGHYGPGYAIFESGWAIEHSTLAKSDGNTSAAGNGHRHNSMGFPAVNFGDGGHYHSHTGTNSSGNANSGSHSHSFYDQKDTWTSPSPDYMLPYNSAIFYIKV